MFKHLYSLTLPLALLCGGCNGIRLTPDTATLTAQTDGTLTPPNCNSCHDLNQKDHNHYFHLISLNNERFRQNRNRPNGFITCFDCHSESVAHFKSTHSETLWVDTLGSRVTHRTSPKDVVDQVTVTDRFHPVPYGLVDTSRGEPLGIEVDSLIASYARIEGSPQWRTAWKHNNGQVSVNFPSNVLNSDLNGQSAYHPESFTCSSIACHHEDGPYDWRQGLNEGQ